VVAIGLAAAGWFCWWRYHEQIAATVIIIQHWQMAVIAHFTDRYRALDAQAAAIGPANMMLNQLYQLCHLVGLWFRVPVVLVVAGLGLACAFLAPAARYRRNLDLDRLIKAQAGVFPTTRAYVVRRETTPSMHGPEWIEKYASGPDGFDEDAARRELREQLGPQWQGVSAAEPHVRCLFAVFALHGARHRAIANCLLGEMARSPLRFPEHLIAHADELLRDPELARDCGEVAARHAYTMPAMMGVLCHARRRAGVLAPAQFNFLKLVDRRLWYALHSLGFPNESDADFGPMPNPLIEAVGARAHWHAELIVGGPLHTPQLAEAVAAIRAKIEQVSEMEEASNAD
jgi:intracellular multiplication protein IcmP